VKRIAIVQSNYIPWKGYFDLINMVDEFILIDDLQYTKGDWRNRNRIKTEAGVKWLTIPVSVEHWDVAIKDVVVSDNGWARTHWQHVVPSYSKAAFFHELKELFEGLYLGCTETHLSRINYRFITAICELLGITTRISWSMDYRLRGGKSERLVNLCRQSGSTEYLSGPSARCYLDEELFATAGINVKWMAYDGYTEYRQLYCPPFVHEVSIIDLILNEGAEGAKRHMLSFPESEACPSRLPQSKGAK
jgi:hypothetical protein